MNKRSTKQLNIDNDKIFNYLMCESARDNAIPAFTIHKIFDAEMGRGNVNSSINSLAQAARINKVGLDEGGRDYREALKQGARPKQLYVANTDGKFKPGQMILNYKKNMSFMAKHNLGMIIVNGKPKLKKLK